MNPRLFVALVIVAGELFAAAQCSAGCGQLFHHKQAVVVQQVVAVPQIYYSVGESVQIEAAVEKAFLRRELRLQQLQQAPQQQTAAQQGSVFAAKCLRCHSGEAAKGAVRLDGFIDAATRWRITELLSGHDVPDAMKGVIGALQPGDHPAILQELMNQRRLPAPPGFERDGNGNTFKEIAPAKPPENPPVPADPFESPGVLR